jgi:hypothetical protein
MTYAEAEQGVDRGQPGVPGGAAVPPLFFQVMQERADERGVEVGEAEPAGRLPGLVLPEGEQEPARVAVSRDRVGLAFFCRASRSVKNPCRMGARPVIGLPARPPAVRAGRPPGRGARGRPAGTSRSTSGQRGRARSTAAVIRKTRWSEVPSEELHPNFFADRGDSHRPCLDSPGRIYGTHLCRIYQQRSPRST